MTLQEWVDEAGISGSEGARRCNLSQPAFHQYLTGRRTPRDKATFDKILAGTGGRVTPNDFYGIKGAAA